MSHPSSPIWVYTSLFCSSDHWQVLLKEGVQGFLDHWQQEQPLHAFQVQLNYDGGENIRFSLLTDRAHAHSLATRADSWFTTFFRLAKWPEKTIRLPVAGIFLPFPSNTIRYGLYGHAAPEGDYKYEMEQALSRILLDVLGEDEAADETILTLVFYLRLMLLKVSREAGVMDLESLLDKPVRSSSMGDAALISMEQVHEKFEAGKQGLLEITSTIFRRVATDTAPVWLDHWELICQSMIKRWLQTVGNKVANVQPFHDQCAGLVNRQAGLQENACFLLQYFLREVIKEDASHNVIPL